jgi:putative ABC transport system ATP-binding protein
MQPGKLSKGSGATTVGERLTISGQPSQDAVFHVHGISKVYQTGEVEVWALREIDFDLYPAELVVLLGPSGSGKSTLLNILGGLDTPSSGEVFFLDHNLTAASDAELTRFRREHVGFVFQFYNLIPSLTALENVALVTEIVPNPITPEESLRIVGLGDKLNSFPSPAIRETARP